MHWIHEWVFLDVAFKKHVTFSSLSLYLDFRYLVLSVKALSLRSRGSEIFHLMPHMVFGHTLDLGKDPFYLQDSLLHWPFSICYGCYNFVVELTVCFLLTQSFIFILCAWVICLHVCVPLVWLVPAYARRRHQVSRKCSYRRFSARSYRRCW